MSDLDRLIEAVEAGEWTPEIRPHLSKYCPKNFSNKQAQRVTHAYLGSLDAAKRLHDALLPGWAVDRVSQDREGYWCVILMTKVEPWQASTAIQADFARAWLLAILKAYRSTQP